MQSSIKYIVLFVFLSYSSTLQALPLTGNAPLANPAQSVASSALALLPTAGNSEMFTSGLENLENLFNFKKFQDVLSASDFKYNLPTMLPLFFTTDSEDLQKIVQNYKTKYPTLMVDFAKDVASGNYMRMLGDYKNLQNFQMTDVLNGAAIMSKLSNGEFKNDDLNSLFLIGLKMTKPFTQMNLRNNFF